MSWNLPPGVTGHEPEIVGHEESWQITACADPKCDGSCDDPFCERKELDPDTCPDTGRTRCDCRSCIDRLKAEAAYWEGRSRGEAAGSG